MVREGERGEEWERQVESNILYIYTGIFNQKATTTTSTTAKESH